MLKKIIDLSRINIIPFAVIILVSFIAYHNTLKTPFIYDDQGNIVGHTILPLSFQQQVKALYNTKVPYWERSLSDRPVTYLSLSLNYAFGKLNPFGYHLFNTIIHILVAILVYLFSRYLFSSIFNNSSNMPALLTALIFAVHPINTESVTYISNRSGELAALFYFLSIMTFIYFNSRKKWSYYYISLICFVLSLLSKQSAAVLPLMLLLYDYFFISNYNIPELIRKKKYHLPFWLLTIAYIAAYAYFYREGAAPAEFKTQYPGFSYFIVQPWAMAKFIFMLFVPAGLSIDHMIAPIKILSFKFILSTLLLLGIFWGTFLVYRKNTPISKVIVFCVLWAFINVFPTNIFITQIGERHWYISSFAFALLFVLGLYYFAKYLNEKYINKEHWKIFAVITCAYITVLCVLTIQRNNIYKDPIKMWENVVAQYPINYKAHLNLGVAYSNIKDYDKAIDSVNRSNNINPYSADGYTDLGLFYIAKNEYGMAEACLKKAIEINNTRPTFFVNLGKLYQDEKRYDEAMAEYQKALAINPNLPQVYNNMGVMYIELKKLDTAIGYLKKAIELNRDFGLAHSNLANIYSQELKRNDLALEEYLKAVSLSPDNYNAQNNLGLLYKNIGKLNEALVAFNNAISANPNFELPYYNIGTIYFDLRDYINAYINFQKTIKINPYYCPAYHQIGNIFYSYGQFEDAVKWYLKAIAVDQNYADSYVNLGLSYTNLGKLDEAVAMYEKAIKLVPNFTMAHNNFGVLYARLKQYNKAIYEYNKAIESNPRYVEAYNNLGTLWFNLKEYSKAIENYKKAQEINPNYPDAYLNLGLLYEEKKDYKSALDVYGRYLKLNNHDEKIKGKLQSIEVLLGNIHQGAK